MLILYIGAAVLAGLAVFVLVMALLRFIMKSSEVDDRLTTYAHAHAPFGREEERPRVADRVNNFLNERSFSASIAANLARAAAKLTVAEYLLIKVAAALLPFGACLFITRQLVPGLVVGALCFVAPDLWLRRRQHRRSADFVLQLPDTLALIVSGLRAGFSLQQSLVNVAKETPYPTSAEFNRLAQELRLGVSLVEALDGLARRIKSEDLDMIVSVFKIHGRVGGNLATILETVSSTIRERVRLRREVQVITSMQRYSSYVLGLLPIGLGLILLVLNPDYILSMFAWNVLLCIPVGALTMTVAGFLVIRRMADIKI